ncbi:hypothetical protein [Actinacidiphila sp. bgisy144]|uniref:hypothetical protein n=1 Tax=Actinacidiphila sp. bgisy144 TaxID=3413791 RepID=UPI003EBD3997
MTREQPRVAAVPAITAWSGELRRARELEFHPILGVRFADEDPSDRIGGVLWASHREAPGEGHPQFTVIHPQRQRAAMQGLLCQVCGQVPPADERGPLWLIREEYDAWEEWPEGAITTHPPVCPPCAQLARDHCPEVGGVAYTAVRSAASALAGVHGTVYVPYGTGDMLMPIKAFVEIGDPRMRWVVAGQLGRSLHRTTVVDLDIEIAAAIATPAP